MSLNENAEKVSIALGPVIQQLGYEVVDVEFMKKGEDLTLTVYIDISSGISLDDCEKVHRTIDPILDEINPTGDKPYTLNVSSPGLDRPFKKLRDFERNYGKEVELKLYAPYRGKKYFEGILKLKENNVVTITVDEQDIKFEMNKVSVVRPAVKFE